uniref:Uncharacterized protein n=1 Tax=Chondria sp. (in: red algae) TaxID=1982705 RepID=A0A1Z1MDG4_9FLOR|nr:hypothetical protein [Chondria sp. (in: red algae)]
MMLLNFSSYSHTLDLYYGSNAHLTFKLVRDIQKNKKNINLNQNRRYNFIALNTPLTNNFRLSKISNNNEVIIRNFWQKLVNKYWQETIFISSSNSTLQKYTDKLKTSGLSVYGSNDYKNFLMQFSKDLIDRKINLNIKSSTSRDFSYLMNKHDMSIKYKWLKNFNLGILLNKSGNMKLKNFNFVNRFHNRLPIFILINNNNQIILAESSDLLSNRQRALKLYNKFTGRALNNKKLYTGLFFINPQDAVEYQNYINDKHKHSTHNLAVKPVATTLNFYYKMLNQSDGFIDFRLVPDLKEVSDLIYTYRHYNNFKFDKNQKYSSVFFQGQPIYIINSLPVSKSIKQDNLNYSYLVSRQKNNQKRYQVVFLNYATAISAWKNYKKSCNDLHLPMKPNIYVSNLETFVQADSSDKYKDQMILLPSLETFNFMKNHFHSMKNSNFLELLKTKGLHVRSLCYRTLWSLTTRQPTAW